MSNSVKDVLVVENLADFHSLLDQFIANRKKRSFLPLQEVAQHLNAWSRALQRARLDIDGIPFLALWLREANLQQILNQEVKTVDLTKGLLSPLGVIGHWPAANVPVQPFLAASMSLLADNVSIVRVPKDLVDVTRRILQVIVAAVPQCPVLENTLWVHFSSDRVDLHSVMASKLDGASAWGGDQAIRQVRALDFPSHSKLLTFGPRNSIAVVDRRIWGSEAQRSKICTRIARDLWQFDQFACSSPQILYLVGEASPQEYRGFLDGLKVACEEEARIHPRATTDAALSYNISQARFDWLKRSDQNSALFPEGVEWTLLFGPLTTMENFVGGKTLYVLPVPSLEAVLSTISPEIQTIGTALGNEAAEQEFAQRAVRLGVDRVVKLGQMHTFSSPWDGKELIRPFLRISVFQSSSPEFKDV